MKLFLTHSSHVGKAKAYLLCEVLRTAAQKVNVSLVENAAEADVVLVVGSQLPNNAALVGKKYGLLMKIQ
ncbi:PTS system fructose-specific transporter subunits IIBC [Rodentibacter pneumotropicus]|uniref:PTS system fructose-specific transporter subunits IIBC n=1 Tax=Rodentibacter pneumotropicus TaxID=758 RepID=A0A448MJ70_9PAST|nr:PTS system fructose-specific transporter subunits IIBC [Rodentibacter pneumotropicus]